MMMSWKLRPVRVQDVEQHDLDGDVVSTTCPASSLGAFVVANARESVLGSMLADVPEALGVDETSKFLRCM